MFAIHIQLVTTGAPFEHYEVQWRTASAGNDAPWHTVVTGKKVYDPKLGVIVSGLSPATAYTFRARGYASDSSGKLSWSEFGKPSASILTTSRTIGADESLVCLVM